MYENNNHNTPGATSVPPTPAYSDPAVDLIVDSAFGKALASAIMCEFPIASIIAIVIGSQSLDLVEQAKNLAAQRGAKPSGKIIAATVLGKIGKIAGIIMTCFWGIYLFIILAAIFSTLV